MLARATKVAVKLAYMPAFRMQQEQLRRYCRSLRASAPVIDKTEQQRPVPHTEFEKSLFLTSSQQSSDGFYDYLLYALGRKQAVFRRTDLSESQGSQTSDLHDKLCTWHQSHNVLAP